jgi:hypothetical protein
MPEPGKYTDAEEENRDENTHDLQNWHWSAS